MKSLPLARGTAGGSVLLFLKHWPPWAYPSGMSATGGVPEIGLACLKRLTYPI